MKIYIGADHRGFELKKALKEYLKGKGFKVDDAGSASYDEADDYPDFAVKVASEVSKNPEEDRGILLCGSGMGMDVVANKVKGVRATVAYSRESAEHARARDNVNVITLASDVLSEKEAQEIAMTFLKTEFGRAERDLRRLKKVREIEGKNFR